MSDVDKEMALRWADRHEKTMTDNLTHAGVPLEERSPVPGPYFVRQLLAERDALHEQLATARADALREAAACLDRMWVNEDHRPARDEYVRAILKLLERSIP